MKRTLHSMAYVLALILVIGALASCQKAPTGTPDTPVPEFTGFTVSDLQNILVIYPEYCSDELFRAGKALCDAIEDKTSIRPTYRSSYVDGTSPEYTEAEYEILLGVCDEREESADAARSMRVKDYGYKLVGKKIVFFGASDAMLMEAMKSFTERVVNVCTSDVDSPFYSYTMDYLYEADYDMDSVAIHGTSIHQYGIVYPNKGTLSESKHASRLASLISDKTGYALTVTSDKSLPDAGTKWIRIGHTANEDADSATDALTDGQYRIATDENGNISILAGDISGYIGGVDALLSMLTDGGKTANVQITNAIEGERASNQLSIMSFNILTTKPDEARINRVVNTILNADPDTVGLQEVSPYWMDILKARLGHIYGYVGEGRDGGHNGEYSCIFYKKDRFELLESDTYWLSETPEKVSSYETSAYRRIMTFAKLRCKSNGQEFVHINTHLDHESLEARIFQAGVLVSFAEKHAGLPILMTGDFNCVASEETYKTVTGAGFTNAALDAPVAEKKATFPGNGKVIDFVFCTDSVYPAEYEVIDEKIDGEYPSDHYPIFLRYEM